MLKDINHFIIANITLVQTVLSERNYCRALSLYSGAIDKGTFILLSVTNLL